MPASRLRDIDTVFLDRDGTINVKQPEGQYVTSPAELVLLPGAAQAVARLNAAGMRTILVTNQSWLSRSPGAATRYAAVHARLTELLAAEGAHLDAAYHCPHAPAADCDCRKPKPGLLLQAAKEHQIDLDKAVIIGDRQSDLLAGRAAGMATILVGPERHPALLSRPERHPTAVRAELEKHPTAEVEDLAEAAGLILAVNACG